MKFRSGTQVIAFTKAGPFPPAKEKFAVLGRVEDGKWVEGGPTVLMKAKHLEDGIYLDNGRGNDPLGPYDPQTGKLIGHQIGKNWIEKVPDWMGAAIVPPNQIDKKGD